MEAEAEAEAEAEDDGESDVSDFSMLLANFDFASPNVEDSHSVNWLRVALILVSMVGDAVGAFNMLSSNFYYYNSGKHLTKFFSAGLVVVDEVFDLGIIVPTKAWIRYA
jgi:hypothetical protein